MKTWFGVLTCCALFFVCACQQDKQGERAYEAVVAEVAPSKNENKTATYILQTENIFLKNLLSEADSLKKSNPEIALDLYFDLLHKSKAGGQYEFLVKAYDNIIAYYQHFGDQVQAAHFLDLAVNDLQILLENDWLLPYRNVDLKLYYSLIRFYNYQESWSKITATYQSIYKRCQVSDSAQQEMLADIRLIAGLAYFTLAQYDSASMLMKQNLLQLKTATPQNYKKLAYTYMGLGNIDGRMNRNSNKGIIYYENAERISRQFGDDGVRASILSNIGAFYFSTKNFELAKVYCLEALHLARHIKDPFLQRSNELQNAYLIASSLIEEGKPQEALPYSKLALTQGARSLSNNVKIGGLFIMGYNMIQLQQYAAGDRYLSQGMQLAQKAGLIDNMISGYEQLSIANYKLGNYKNAYLYSRQYGLLLDSLMGKEKASLITEFNTQYAVAVKDEEIVQKNNALMKVQLKMADKEKQQYLWIGGILLLLLSIAALWRNRQHKVAITHLKSIIEGEERERTRMARELHDGIVSRLFVVQMNLSVLPQQYTVLTQKKDFEEVVTQLDQCIKELRTTSHNLLPEILEQAGLIQSLAIYCKRVSVNGVFNLEFQLIGDLPELTADFKLNVYRIVQELINNIVKHSKANHALIQFHVEPEELFITIDYEGQVQTVHKINPDPGIGLQNLRNRVKLLEGTFNMEQGNSTSLYLEFPLNKFILRST